MACVRGLDGGQRAQPHQVESRAGQANAWGAAELCSARTIAGRFGNPPRVSITMSGNLPTMVMLPAWHFQRWSLRSLHSILRLTSCSPAWPAALVSPVRNSFVVSSTSRWPRTARDARPFLRRLPSPSALPASEAEWAPAPSESRPGYVDARSALPRRPAAGQRNFLRAALEIGGPTCTHPQRPRWSRGDHETRDLDPAVHAMDGFSAGQPGFARMR